MSGPRYTREALLNLRQSPLVQKPESLPSIEQWIDQPQDQNQRKPRTQSARNEDTSSPMGNFASQRPSLLQTRQTSRSAAGEDVVLGPPKMSFASSRSISRLVDAGESAVPASPGDEERDLESLSARTRFFRDKDDQTKGGLNKDRESWTAGRNGKSYEARPGYGEKDRPFSRNPRERGDRAEGEEDPGRRNGYGNKYDQRWSREADKATGRLPAQERGWRDRERRPERDYDRGGAAEKEPEWMDEPLEQEEEQAHTVAEFEKWKQRMKAGNAQAQEKENVESRPLEMSPVPTKAAEPLIADAAFGNTLFGTWGEAKRTESAAPVDVTPAATPAPKSAAAKKSSRFASMFAPKEEVRQAPEPLASPNPLMAAANGSTEDKDSFQRVLQMLRGTNMGADGPNSQAPQLHSPPGPPPGMLGLFDSAISDAKRASPPQSPAPQGLQALFGAKPTSKQHQRPESARDPGQPFATAPRPTDDEPKRHSRPQEMQSVFLDQPPRNIHTPEAQNIQSLLAGQRSQKTPALDKNSEMLLNLIQAKSASRPPSQAARHQEPDGNFQLFLDQPPKPQGHLAQPRAPPPPGFSPDQLFQHREQQVNYEPAPEPRQNVRPPPGFFDDPSIVQRGRQASFAEARSPPRRQPAPPGFAPHPNDHAFFANQQLQQERMPPPPGFAPNMRQPQGFPNLPNIFQQSPAQHPPQGQMGAHMHPSQQGGHHQLPPHQRGGLPPGISSPHDGPAPGPGPGPFGGMPPPPGFFGGPAHAPGLPLGYGGPQHQHQSQGPPPPPGMGMGMRSPEGIRSPPGGIDMAMGGMFGGLGQRR